MKTTMNSFYALLAATTLLASPAFAATVIGHASDSDPAVPAPHAVPTNSSAVTNPDAPDTSTPDKITHKKIPAHTADKIGSPAGGKNLDDASTRVEKADHFNENKGYESTGESADTTAVRNPAGIVRQQ